RWRKRGLATAGSGVADRLGHGRPSARGGNAAQLGLDGASATSRGGSGSRGWRRAFVDAPGTGSGADTRAGPANPIRFGTGAGPLDGCGLVVQDQGQAERSAAKTQVADGGGHGGGYRSMACAHAHGRQSEGVPNAYKTRQLPGVAPPGSVHTGAPRPVAL